VRGTIYHFSQGETNFYVETNKTRGKHRVRTSSFHPREALALGGNKKRIMWGFKREKKVRNPDHRSTSPLHDLMRLLGGNLSDLEEQEKES